MHCTARRSLVIGQRRAKPVETSPAIHQSNYEKPGWLFVSAIKSPTRPGVLDLVNERRQKDLALARQHQTGTDDLAALNQKMHISPSTNTKSPPPPEVGILCSRARTTQKRAQEQRSPERRPRSESQAEGAGRAAQVTSAWPVATRGPPKPGERFD